MSSISPREEQPSSKARRSFKTIHDESMRSLPTDGLSSGYDGPGLMHSDMGFTSSPRQEKSKNALSDSPTRPMSDGITIRKADDVDGHREGWCIVEYQAATSIDVIVSGSYPSAGNG